MLVQSASHFTSQCLDHLNTALPGKCQAPGHDLDLLPHPLEPWCRSIAGFAEHDTSKGTKTQCSLFHPQDPKGHWTLPNPQQFLVYNMSFANRDSLASFSICISLISFSYFLPASGLNIVLKRSRYRGQPCLIPDLSGIVSSFSPFRMMFCWLWISHI